MGQAMQSITKIVLDLFKTCKSQVEQNIDKEKLIRTLTDEAVHKVKDYAKSQGVHLNDDVIDVEPIRDLDEPGATKSGAEQNKRPIERPVPNDWFGLMRYHLNKGVHDLFSAIKLEKVADILTLDVKKLFKLDERDIAVVNSIKETAENIGGAFDKMLRVPVVGPVLGKVAEILSAVGCKTVNNRKLIIETEFAEENLRELMEFGVRHDQLSAIANAMFQRLNELDHDFAAQIAENEALKARVLSNIAAAHARVNAEIDRTSERLSQGADQFDADMQNLINRI